jgi:hypothetical protein
MLTWPVPIPPDKPRWADIILIWGLPHLRAFGTKVSGRWVFPGRGSSAPFRHRLPRYVTSPSCWGGGEYGWLRVLGEVSMCVLLNPQHGHDPRCGGETLHIERGAGAPQKSSIRSVGHPTGCWRQLEDTWGALGSAASSAEASRPLTLEEC